MVAIRLLVLTIMSVYIIEAIYFVHVIFKILFVHT